MAKKDYFCIIDTETTQDHLVADFAAVICDRKGNVYNKCAVLVLDIYNNPAHPLFFDPNAPANAIWSKQGKDKRYTQYNKMLAEGSRMMASVTAINRWMEKAIAIYNPYLTAYNVAFDIDKCNKTGIDLSGFTNNFCLWHGAFNKFAHKKAFREFILQNHLFNNVTGLGNMSYKTNAEVMTKYLAGDPDMPDEPHTALEDILFYELPILVELVKNTKKADWLNPEPFDWRRVQVRDWFKAK